MAQARATIHVVPHFHYDPVWIEDQRTYTEWAFRLIEQYLAACERDNGYCFILSEVDYLKPYLGVYGERRQQIRDLIAAGRLELGGSYSQPNELSLQGEAIIRNLVYGRRYVEGLLGARPRVYMPLDVFGHCVQLPQLAAKAGFEAIVWSKEIIGAPPLCLGLAPDGTRLLQKREPYWYQADSLEAFLETVAGGLEHQAALGLRQDLRLLGMDMAAPPPWLAGRSAELAMRDPALLISTPGRYLDAVLPEVQARGAAVPTVGKDLSWYHGGTAVSRADLKIANRLAENRLLAAERWATLASLLGARYPDPALDKAWRQVLFGQHHDAITGTPHDIPFVDLLAGYREALELAAEVEGQALSYISGRANTAAARGAARAESALLVFNPLGWRRTDVCRATVPLRGALGRGFELVDERGRRAPVQLARLSGSGEEARAEIVFLAREVPGMGYRTYYLRPARHMPPLGAPRDASSAVIENGFFSVRAEAEAGGGITSLFDKRQKRELIARERGPANELLALAERGDRQMSPWELFTTGEMVRASERPARVTVVEGPVFSQIRVRGELPGRCGVVQEITLYRGLRRVDLRTELEHYQGLHELLALAFPLALRGAAPVFEDRFAVVARPRSRGRLDYRTLNEANLSGCGLGAAQNWVEAGPGPSLWVMEKGRRVGAASLSPCMIVTSDDLKVRAAVPALSQALLARGVTNTPWLDTQEPETEPCLFRISLGRDNAYSRLVLQGAPGAAEKLAEAVSEGEWGGVLVRRPDPRGEGPEAMVLVADTAAPEGLPKLVEMLAAAVTQDRLAIPRHCDLAGAGPAPDDYGVALINRGTPGASLEADGTLVGLLFHTSAWSMSPWGDGRLEPYFVPEHKTHVFEHALLPHPGDWRAGGVVRAGYELNMPLRPRQVEVGEGDLPGRFGLLEVEAPNVVVAAVKPAGYPLAEGLRERSDPRQDGVVVRLYEAHGSAGEVELGLATEPEELWVSDFREQERRPLELRRRGLLARGVSVPLGGCSVETVGVRLTNLWEPGESAELGPDAEPQQPVHCRWWEHNAGAAPMGNQPVTLWMRGELPVGETTRFSLGLSHDGLGGEIAGSVRLIPHPDWQLIPTQVPYRIGPGAQAVYEVMIRVPRDTTPGFLRAVAEEYGQTLQEVLPIGEILPLEVSLSREAGALVVEVANPNQDYVEGEVVLVTPLES